MKLLGALVKPVLVLLVSEDELPLPLAAAALGEESDLGDLGYQAQHVAGVVQSLAEGRQVSIDGRLPNRFSFHRLPQEHVHFVALDQRGIDVYQRAVGELVKFEQAAETHLVELTGAEMFIVAAVYPGEEFLLELAQGNAVGFRRGQPSFNLEEIVVPAIGYLCCDLTVAATGGTVNLLAVPPEPVPEDFAAFLDLHQSALCRRPPRPARNHLADSGRLKADRLLNLNVLDLAMENPGTDGVDTDSEDPGDIVDVEQWFDFGCGKR